MRAAQEQAKNVYNESQGVAKTSGAHAGQLYDVLEPTLATEATAPKGYDPLDVSAMNTAAQESTGGATAGAKGEGYLDAARTGNRGGFQTAVASSAREAAKINSDAALGVQQKNADLKERNRQAGIAGLGQLYGENSADELKALGLSDQSINTELDAGKSGWQQNLMAWINTLKKPQGGGDSGAAVSG